MPACLAIIAERAFACPLHSTWSASLRCERHDLVWCEWRRNRWQHFFLAQRSYQVLWLTPPSYHRPLHVMPDSEWMRSSHISWQRLSMSSGCTRVLAYFHIQVAPHHIWFLRFAFEGVAYQYKVLPFGLSLAPHTFTQCLDAALSPLRQMGIRILNYLDDWLILSFWFSYRLNADDSNCLSGVNYANSAPRGFHQGRYRPSAQSFPDNLCSLKATHVPGKMNQGADMLSRNNVSSEEWKRAPPARGSENLGSLLQSSSRPLRLQRQLSLSNLFYKEHGCPGPWMACLPLYAFSPVALLPQVLRRVREQHKLILIAPLWRSQPWVWVIPAAESSLVADPLETGPSLSSKRQWYGIHSLSYGPCMWPRLGPRPCHLRCVSGSFISAGDAG